MRGPQVLQCRDACGLTLDLATNPFLLLRFALATLLLLLVSGATMVSASPYLET